MDDFCNDISGRKGLTQLIDSVSIDVKSKIVRIITPLDNTFANYAAKS